MFCSPLVLLARLQCHTARLAVSHSEEAVRVYGLCRCVLWEAIRTPSGLREAIRTPCSVPYVHLASCLRVYPYPVSGLLYVALVPSRTRSFAGLRRDDHACHVRVCQLTAYVRGVWGVLCHAGGGCRHRRKIQQKWRPCLHYLSSIRLFVRIDMPQTASIEPRTAIRTCQILSDCSGRRSQP